VEAYVLAQYELACQVHRVRKLLRLLKSCKELISHSVFATELVAQIDKEIHDGPAPIPESD